MRQYACYVCRLYYDVLQTVNWKGYEGGTICLEGLTKTIANLTSVMLADILAEILCYQHPFPLYIP
jgi:hypothetical protein